MCGIVGFVCPGESGRASEGRRIAAAMGATLTHRGPDDAGEWGAPGIYLAHRRLAIQDLSSDGRQPMTSADGRWTVVFNGEIYNFRELRGELEKRGHVLRGHSDTEVLLELVADLGPKDALARSRGMFALALWDARDRILYLARDRIGEKPLYYGWLGSSFAFASELRALRVHPGWSGQVDRSALASFLRHNCVPAPLSIFAGIRKLEPGMLLTLRAGAPAVDLEHYWSPDDALLNALAHPWTDSAEDFVDALGELLGSAIRDQMIADVPLGAFLSGGIDSSLVVALMQSQSSRPVRTFTVGFGEPGFDESGYAREIAGILGTNHTEERLSGADAVARVPSLPQCYDEPFADASQLPTLLVSEVARKHVTVALSGDGGDELFGGYPRYMQVLARWRRLKRVPAGMRVGIAEALDRLPEPAFAGAGGLVQAFKPRPLPSPAVSWRVRQRVRSWADRDLPDTYLRAMSFWDRPADIVAGGNEVVPTEPGLAGNRLMTTDPVRWMMYRDARTYLPDDILVKVDRASMRVSLECRIPLLDHRLVELAWRAPAELSFRDGRGKWPLRSLLERYIPRRLIDRSKMGFAVPLNDWLRGPLRAWAEELLEPSRLSQEGWFRPALIRRRWRDLLAGGEGHDLALWSVLMFQGWNEHWQVARTDGIMSGNPEGP